MRSRSAAAVAVTVLAVALAGCTAPPAPPPGGPAPEPAPAAAEPRVVIAVIDTGINLYHAEYRREGLDKTALAAQVPALAGGEAVPLSLGMEWEDAVDADMDALMAMEPGRLYTFPGTKVSAISFDQRAQDWPLVLDRPGFYTHGTMTSSRAVGNTVSIGAGDPGIELVLVQGFRAEAVRWAAEQDWIDIISISAGISPFSLVPLVPNLADDQAALGGEDAIGAYRDASHAKPFFASTGNGVTNFGLLGFPSWLRGSSGVPDAISVGANDNDHLSHWHNQDPYISADGCSNPSANPGDTEEVWDRGGGTSSATPFSAGGGAKLLLEARRILGDAHVGPRVDEALQGEGWDSLAPSDAQVVLARGEPGVVASGPLADGVLTLREFKDVLYHTALPVPTDDESDGVRCDPTTFAPGAGGTPFGGTYVPASAVPEAARFPFQGYGEVNHASIAAAIEVLQGAAELPARPDEDGQYARAHQLKSSFVGS